MVGVHIFQICIIIFTSFIFTAHGCDEQYLGLLRLAAKQYNDKQRGNIGNHQPEDDVRNFLNEVFFINILNKDFFIWVIRSFVEVYRPNDARTVQNANTLYVQCINLGLLNCPDLTRNIQKCLVDHHESL
ncbi:hypothetical protein RF11_00307 [Thelohanellus kitauei]|uniref:Uncharacterized protein n=1 Tax=Thelohanellus kitauei TaxID=669202 RepID=A0A0C2N9V9_THEKT|nr:hypothetical protein RF11_00307 [Thelohanellus kitauei]